MYWILSQFLIYLVYIFNSTPNTLNAQCGVNIYNFSQTYNSGCLSLANITQVDKRIWQMHTQQPRTVVILGRCSVIDINRAPGPSAM